MARAVSSGVKIELIFRALSDRTRLRILNLLLHGELCVCDLGSILDIPQSSASRHLAYLRRVGLVAARKEAPWSYYRLVPERNSFDEKLRQCLSCCPEVLPQLAQDAALLRRNGRTNCGT